MKALVLKEYCHLEIEDAPTPDPGPEDVLVQVKACGICGSDVHGWDGSTGRRIPPLIMGHEAAGVVAAVGEAVTRFGPGDRVTFDSTIYCGRCWYCQHGQVNLCDHRRVLGVSCQEYRQHGAFAEYVVVPERIVFPLPDAVTFEQAAMIEPLSVALHAVDRGSPKLGETALILGGGMIGLLILQVARAAGLAWTGVVEPDPFRQQLAQKLGADFVCRPEDETWSQALAQATGGERLDLAIDAVGIGETFKSAVTAVAKGGRVVLVGNLQPEVVALLQHIVTREITLYGSCASQNDYPRCLQLLARGVVDVEPLTSVVAPLEEAPYWFEELYHRKQPLMKVILRP